MEDPLLYLLHSHFMRVLKACPTMRIYHSHGSLSPI
ncbi:hypothetical protein BVRB_5g114640 [Beta vulgaris subsp. vulgaris]|nr:hypothetical protein BVRB_5g114640 [Beta vulgaris subsp. vulgaris]